MRFIKKMELVVYLLIVGLLVPDVQLDVDFDHAASRGAASAEGSWRLGTLVCIMLSLGISALKVYNNRQNATQATDKKEDVPNGRKASDR